MSAKESEQVVIASSYFKNWDHVILASQVFSSLGKSVYPHDKAGTEKMMEGFLRVTGVDEDIETARKLERAFLERTRKAELLYVVTGRGYIGQSTSAELTYALARSVPVLVSEPIMEISTAVSQEVEDLITKYSPPILPISEIPNRASDIFNGNLHESQPTLTRQEVLTAMHAVRKLQRGWK